MGNVFSDDSLDEITKVINLRVQETLIDNHVAGNIVNEEYYTQSLIDQISIAINGLPVLDLQHKPIPGLGNSSRVGSVELRAASAGRPTPDIKIRGRQLIKQTEEPVIGADILLVLHSKDIDGLETKKGLLAQSKRRDTNFNRTSDPELRRQCEKMNQYAKDHYAIIYAHNGLHIYKSAHEKKVLYRRDSEMTIGALVAKFVDCQIGDPEVNHFDVRGFLPAISGGLLQFLADRISEVDYSNTLLISASPPS